MGTLDDEWRQYTDAFVGVAYELCGRTSRGKGGTPRSRNRPRMVDGRGGEGSGVEAGSMKMIGGFRDTGKQPPTSLRHLYGQKKKAARRAVDRARRSMVPKACLFNIARDRTEDGRDAERGAVIKDKYERSSQKVRKC